MYVFVQDNKIRTFFNNAVFWEKNKFAEETFHELSSPL